MPQESLDSFAPEFREGMAARAADAGRRRREQPRALGDSRSARADVHVAIAVLSPDAARLEAVAEQARRAHAGAAGRRGDLAPGLLPARRPGGPRSASRTASASRRSRAADGPPTNPQERPLKAGEIILGYPDETGELPPMPTPGRPRPQRHLRRLPQAAHQGRGLPAVPARPGGEPRGGGAARREDGRALAERRPARARPRRATTPSSAPTRGATTTSSTATTRAASSARSAPTRGGPTRATPSTTTAASTSGCTA